MKQLFLVASLLAISSTPVAGMLVYKVKKDVVPYDGYFHDFLHHVTAYEKVLQVADTLPKSLANTLLHNTMDSIKKAALICNINKVYKWKIKAQHSAYYCSVLQTALRHTFTFRDTALLKMLLMLPTCDLAQKTIPVKYAEKNTLAFTNPFEFITDRVAHEPHDTNLQQIKACIKKAAMEKLP